MIEGRWFALADIAAFEKAFGPQPFYRVIEADARDQSVKVATGDWLRYLEREYDRGGYNVRQRRHKVMLQPIDTWKPTKDEKSQ